MTQEIVCPHCQRKLRLADAQPGQQIRCPQCHHILRLPGPGAAVPDPVESWQMRAEDGVLYGPVPRDTLQLWVREGRVAPRSQLLRVGDQQWLWASQVFPELATAAGRTPAVTAKSPSDMYVGAVSSKSRVTAGLLGLLLPWLGLCGIHRLYLGHVMIGLLMLITLGGCGIWQLLDVIFVFAGDVRDGDGLPLRD